MPLAIGGLGGGARKGERPLAQTIEAAEAFAAEMIGRDESEQESGSAKRRTRTRAKAQSSGSGRSRKSAARATSADTKAETASVPKDVGGTMPAGAAAGGERGM